MDEKKNTQRERTSGSKIMWWRKTVYGTMDRYIRLTGSEYEMQNSRQHFFTRFKNPIFSRQPLPTAQNAHSQSNASGYRFFSQFFSSTKSLYIPNTKVGAFFPNTNTHTHTKADIHTDTHRSSESAERQKCASTIFSLVCSVVHAHLHA